MKIISLWQPWATLWVFQLYKKYETRSWGALYQGPLMVHAAKKCLRITDSNFVEALEHLGFAYDTLPLGAIVGKCDSFVCHKITEANRPTDSTELSFGDFSIGRFMWEPVNMKVLEEPIQTRGFQGLWNWPKEEKKEDPQRKLFE